MIKKHAESILTALTSEHTYISIKGDKHAEYIRALSWLKNVYKGEIQLMEVPKPAKDLVEKAPVSKKLNKVKTSSKAKK